MNKNKIKQLPHSWSLHVLRNADAIVDEKDEVDLNGMISQASGLRTLIA